MAGMVGMGRSLRWSGRHWEQDEGSGRGVIGDGCESIRVLGSGSTIKARVVGG